MEARMFRRPAWQHCETRARLAAPLFCGAQRALTGEPS
jgi:hypothetical protein